MFADIIDGFVVENSLNLQTKNLSYKDSEYFADETQDYSRTVYINKIEFNYKGWKIGSKIDIFQNSKSTTVDDTHYQYLSQEKHGYNIDKLCVQYEVSLSLVDVGFAYGVMPFTGGNFKQYSYQDEVEGNGLFTLSNISVVGGWLILTDKDKDIIVKFGKGVWKKDNFYQDHDIPDELNDRSGGWFFSSEYKLEALKHKQQFQFDYYKIQTERKGEDVDDVDLYGFGYSDESFEYGYVLYTILSKNYTTNDIEHTKKHGQSMLLGAKKYFDLHSLEFDIGYEYFVTSEDFWSAGTGEMWTSDYSNLLGDKFTLNKVYMDFIINKNIIINFSVFQKDYKNSLYDKVQGLQTGISYKF
jgi:hypothetical protein